MIEMNEIKSRPHIQDQILNVIAEKACTMSEIATALDMDKQKVCYYLQKMLKDGKIVSEEGERPEGRGRPPSIYSLADELELQNNQTPKEIALPGKKPIVIYFTPEQQRIANLLLSLEEITYPEDLVIQALNEYCEKIIAKSLKELMYPVE